MRRCRKFLQRVSDMVQAIFAAAGDDQRQQVFLELLSAARHDATILPAMLAPTRTISRTGCSSLIGAGIKEGTLRKVDRDLAAQVLVSLGFGLIMQSLLDPHGADWGDDRVARDSAVDAGTGKEMSPSNACSPSRAKNFTTSRAIRACCCWWSSRPPSC